MLHNNVTVWGSVDDVPEVWQHPVDLLVATQQETTSKCLYHVDKEERCLLPTGLPLLCRNVHLHLWEKVSWVAIAVFHNYSLPLIV